MWTRAPVVGVSTFISQRDLIARIGRAAGTAIRYEQIDGEELIRRSGMRDSYDDYRRKKRAPAGSLQCSRKEGGLCNADSQDRKEISA